MRSLMLLVQMWCFQWSPEGYVEGPVMFIRNGKYYFMWSEGGWTGSDYSVAYAIADSPFGHSNELEKF